MSALREEIRAILREELARLQGEITPAAETVSIGSTAELNSFVQDLLHRASSPDFLQGVMTGRHTFHLQQTGNCPQRTNRLIPVSSNVRQKIVSSNGKSPAQVRTKSLITESDIARMNKGTSLQLAPHNRITPLALDEARRRGIRIEKVKP